MSAQNTISIKKNESTGGATVVVASKLPMDLVMRLYDFKERDEPVMGGGVRVFKIAEQRQETPVFVLTGNSYAQNKGAHQQIVGGYAITRGIPKDFWEQWLAQNERADFIVNHMIFAHSEDASVVAQAKEKEEIKSGLERLDPKALPKGVETSDHFKRAA
ncbi:MAG: hypothetical protein JWP38_3737 [Herbaspirillum sp.]|nr:hypothetical protein [Herbaspirillum sp.]